MDSTQPVPRGIQLPPAEAPTDVPPEVPADASILEDERAVDQMLALIDEDLFDEDDTAELALALADFTADAEALEPTSLADARRRPDWPRWEEGIQEELKTLEEAGTWTLTNLPAGANLVGSKWVFRAKKDAAGNIVRYKARLVAQGYLQVPGVDYFDTYAPVATLASIRTTLALAARLDLEIHQIDIKGAYLNGKLTDDEVIFMRQPPGFESSTHPQKVCRLRRMLYGLKQSGRRWYQRLVEILVDKLGFTQCTVDQEPIQ